PTGGSAQMWPWQPSRTRFTTVVMLTSTCPTSLNFAPPTHIDHPAAGTWYTTRSGVVGSRSGSMKYAPGSIGPSGSKLQMSRAAALGVGVGPGVGIGVRLGVGVDPAHADTMPTTIAANNALIAIALHRKPRSLAGL